MPINPQISLMARAPEMPDPVQQIGQYMTLKDLMQRGKENELDLQAKQGAMQRGQEFRSGLARGASVKELAGIDPEMAIKYAEGLDKLDSNALANEKNRLDNLKQRVAIMGSTAGGILQAPPDRQEIMYQAARKSLIQNGLAKPEEIPEQFDPNFVNQSFQQAISADKQVDAAQKVLDQKLAERKATEEGRHNLATETQQAQSPTESALAYRAAKGDPTAAAALKQLKARTPQPGVDIPLPGPVEAQRIRMRTDEMGMTGGVAAEPAPYTGNIPGQQAERNEQALAGVKPGVANVVKMVVDGRMPLPSGFALRSPYWQNILNIAASYEPGFDATQWRVRLDTRVDFAKGKAAQNVRSLNTLVDHLGKLTDIIGELDNYNFPTWNYISNWSASQVGDPRVVKFKTAAQAVESEAITLFKGTGATDQEIKELRSSFDVNGSPAQQLGAAKTVMQLAFGRMGALESQYENAFRKARDFQFLNDKSRKVLKDKLGVDPNQLDPVGGTTGPAGGRPGMVKLQAPDGTIREVPEAEAQHYISLGAKRVQ